MLEVYFDESGTHNSRVTTVAGLIGESSEWLKLESPWKRLLAPVNCFHATDCRHQDKDFKNFTRDQSDQLFVDLATLISKRRLIPIAGAMYKDDWDYAASEQMKKHLNSPFHAAMIMAFLEVHKLVSEQAPNERVSFVVATHPQYDDFTRSVHEALQNGRWGKNIGSIKFSDPKHSTSLQAADLYAYENYHALLHHLDDPETPCHRPALRIMSTSLNPLSRVNTIEMLNHLALSEEITNL